VTCPACAGYAHTGYRKGRPVPCRKCRGTGRITPAEPQRQTPPTASERAEFFREYNAGYAALIP
jgi:DnaJ-class molecular chaperone